MSSISDEQESSLTPLSASQVEALEEAVSSYEGAHTAESVAYLRARGIDKAEAAGNRLGLVADPAPGHAKYVGMLAIPYLLADGSPVQVRFRCMQEHDHRALYHGKYNTIAGDPARVYNVGAIDKAGNEIHVTEGELDAVILGKCGHDAIAVPGAKSWKGHFRRLLLGFNNIYLWADPDEAGAEMVQKVTQVLPRTTPMRLTEGDVSDTYLEGGAQALLDIYNKYRKE